MNPGWLTRAIAVGATLVVLACGGSLTKDDGGTTGSGGGQIMTGGAGTTGVTGGGAGASGIAGSGIGNFGGTGSGGAGGATIDGGPDTSCVQCFGVHGIISADGDCTFELRCGLPLAARLNVFVDGQLVPNDPTRIEGWEFTDDSMLAFTLYGQACANAISDTGFVDIALSCPLP